MKLALFPLKLVVFPGEELNLHIFEERYRQLIHESAETGKTFGIPAYREGFKMDLGTEVQLKKIVKNYPGGEMDITTKGLRIFKIKTYHSKMDGKLYPGGEVEFLKNIQDSDFVLAEQIITQISTLYNIMGIKKSPPVNTDSFSVFKFAHKIGLTFDQEKFLIETSNESERQNFVLEHLFKMVPMVAQAEEMRKKIQMNGHFKNLIPPL